MVVQMLIEHINKQNFLLKKSWVFAGFFMGLSLKDTGQNIQSRCL